MLEFLKIILVLLFVLGGANGTLIPNGTISLDCGDQQTFTCTVPVGTALWKIVRLIGINAAGSGGGRVASENERIINPLANGAASSTITIIGFNASDDGGTIQCTYDDGLTSTVEGMAIISVGLPSCLTSFSANRDDDFTSATVTYQLDNPPPGTSTTVTYCPTSSPNCGRSMNCPSTGPCTISGLNICVNYSLSAIPNNNCGNATGCNENSMVVLAKAAPSCPRDVKTDRVGRSVTVTWTQDTTPPGTVTEVTFSPSSNGRNSSNCPSMSSCIIDELDPSTKYQFTVFAENNCVRPTRCTGNTATSLPSTGLQIWVIIIIVIVVVIILIAIIVAVVFIVICCCCAVASAWLIATCCCCCKQANKNRNKPERFNQPPDEYVDPKKVREKKEKEEKITYAALEFSEQAGSTGEKPIRSKEEPVQYLAVEQA